MKARGCGRPSPAFLVGARLRLAWIVRTVHTPRQCPVGRGAARRRDLRDGPLT